MTVIVTKEIQKKRILIVALAFFVIATFSILFFGGIIGGGSPIMPDESLTPASMPGATEQGIIVPISDEELKILEDERFTSLLDPPGASVSAETTGNSNPFSD